MPVRWLLLATALAAAFAGLGYLREWPPLATVMSGSMEPTINTGDMVVLRRLDRPARVGDVVVVSVPDHARSRYGYPAVVIHRVKRIAPDGSVTTKGDARKEIDPFTVPVSALSARVVGRVPGGGNILAYLGSPLGLLWLGGGAVLFLAMPLLDRRRQRTEREAGTLRTQLEQITEELVELRYERLAERDAMAQQLATMASAIAALPGQIEVAVTAAAPKPEPEPDPEPVGDPLEQLALALVPAQRQAAAADESEPQLAFLLDVEHRARFARPPEDQLELVLDVAGQPSGQLSLAAIAPRPAAPPPPPPPSPGAPSPPTWDAPSGYRVRRRSGGLVGLALGLVAQAATSS